MKKTIEIQQEGDLEPRIIEGAWRVFVRKGYEATRMGDVAGEVGIGRTALHYYFRTKEMLFDAVFGRLMDGLLPDIGAIVDGPGTYLDKFPRIIDRYVQVLGENPGLPFFVITEMNRDPEHLYRAVVKDPGRLEIFVRLRQQLCREMDEGLIRKVPEVCLITTLLGMLVFPVLMRRPVTDVFMGGDRKAYEKFLTDRIPFVKEVMHGILKPEK